MDWNSNLKDRLSDDFLDQLAASLTQLERSQKGVGFIPLMHLAHQVPHATSLTVDFSKLKLYSAPLVIVALKPHESDVTFWEGLTPREMDVARLLACGLSNKIIARRLGITLGTVKAYVHRILTKTGHRSRASFASRAKIE
jgi:DNA-binding NarL/FixJ family response regulator